MNISKKSIINILFIISYTLLIIDNMMSNVYIIKSIGNLLNIISLASLMLVICFQSNKYTRKSILYILISCTVLMISYFFCGSHMLFLTLLFIIASKNIDFDKIMKYDFWLKLLILILVLLLYKCGLTENVLRYRADGTIRYSYGFGHPNVLGAYLLFICLDLFFINYDKYNVFHYLFLIACFCISYFVCDSRASQICLIILFTFSFLFKYIDKIKLTKIITVILPSFFFIFSLITVKFYINGATFAYRIDKALNHRISYPAIVDRNVGFNLFGSNILSNVTTRCVVDNAYLNIYYQYGFVCLILVVICMTNLLIYCWKNKKNKLLICLIICMIYGYMENYMYFIGVNAFILSISNIFYYKSKKDIIPHSYIK